MEKNKLYLFPYGQDKCHTAYSFQIMYIFTQLLHYQDHMLFSSFYSLTLQNPKSPSCALAVPTSPGLPNHTHVCRVSASPKPSTFACSGLLQDLVLCQEIFLGILGYSCSSYTTTGQINTCNPSIPNTNEGYRRKRSVLLSASAWAFWSPGLSSSGSTWHPPSLFTAPVRSSHFLG